MSLLPEISQASAEINKLVAQANIHQTIARVDPAAFTDPADTMLLASRDPVIREVSVGMTGEAYSDYSVSGTPPLSLPNSLGKPLKAWSVDLLPYQEGSGDPSPDNVRPIHGTDKVTVVTSGKNLIDNDAVRVYANWSSTLVVDGGYPTSDGNKGYLLDVLPNAQYTMSAEANGSTWPPYLYLCKYINGTGTRLNYFRSDNEKVTFTTENGAIYYFRMGSTYSESNFNDSMALLQYIQLEFGSTATPYTHYLAPSQTVLTLPQTVYTGTIGSEGGESRKAYALLNDPDKWQTSNSGTITYMYGQQFRDRKIYPNSSYDGIACTYVPITPNVRFTGRWNGATQYYFGIYDLDGTLTLDQIKADAAAGKIAICYDLATPTTFAVPSATIPTPTGTATTWATAEDGTVESMEVTYVGKA